MKIKTKQKEAKALVNSLYEYIDELVSDIEKLTTENKDLRFQNENLRLEVKRQSKINERQFDAAVEVARRAEKFRKENIELKVRLDVVSKRGVGKDAVV